MGKWNYLYLPHCYIRYKRGQRHHLKHNLNFPESSQKHRFTVSIPHAECFHPKCLYSTVVADSHKGNSTEFVIKRSRFKSLHINCNVNMGHFSLCGEGAHVVINTKMYEDVNSDSKITLLKEETFGLSL